MGTVNFEVHSSVAVITLDDPATKNAVDTPMRDSLKAAYDEVERNDAIRVAVVRGANATFCTGGSIDNYLKDKAFGPGGVGPAVLPKPWGLYKPFIAAIRGHAVGGGFGLALACDLRVLGRSAIIGPSGLKRAVLQGAGVSQMLPRLIGVSKALELMLLSRYISADEALAMGLANAVVDDDQVDDRAMEWAAHIAEYDPWPVAQTKRLVYEGLHLPLNEALKWEAQLALEGYQRPEALENYAAFSAARGARKT